MTDHVTMVTLTDHMIFSDHDVYIRIISEIDLVIGEKVDCSYEKVNKLKYLEACILETLRLNPPQPTIRKYAKHRNNLHLGR